MGEKPEISEKENKDKQIVMDETEEKSNKQENKSISEYVDEEIKMSEKGENNVVVETGSCDQTEKKDILEDLGEVILTVHEIDEKTKNIEGDNENKNSNAEEKLEEDENLNGSLKEDASLNGSKSNIILETTHDETSIDMKVEKKDDAGCSDDGNKE